MTRWIILIAIIAALIGCQIWLDQSSEPHREGVAKPPVSKPAPHKTTMEPGRVVVLQTTKGKIEFVMFEKDCPKTTRRIANLIACGAYNGVKMPRVEKELVQTASSKAQTEGINVELADRLYHVAGAVGMARTQAYDSNTSEFYILKKPVRMLDGEYTVFGHVITGMDVLSKIKSGDIIKSATMRPSTQADLDVLKHADMGKPMPRPNANNPQPQRGPI